MNVVRFYSLFVALWCALALLGVAEGAQSFTSAYISEFSAANRNGLKDDQGQPSGWIELYNGGNAPVNLNGWHLTDTATNLMKWRFPGIVLLPGKYLVVFASGKDRTNDLAHLHTNFRLEKKAYIALVNPSTNIVSDLTGEPGSGSYGRVHGEPAIHGKMTRATPGRANASSGSGFAPEVIFSPSGGTFTNTMVVQLSTASKGVVIRYTLDGKMPTSSSPQYAGPLVLTNSAQLRARSYQEGLFPGPPRTEAYLKLASNVLNFTSTLPVLVMDTFGKYVPTSAQGSFVYLTLFEPVEKGASAKQEKGNGVQAHSVTSLTNPPTLTTRAGFRVRGSTSSGFAQSPFAMEFLDEFNEERHLPLLGLPADSDWVLYAPNTYDLVMIHNPFVYQLSRDMGRYSPRTRFVEVFVVRSSGAIREAHYNGVYVLTEKIKVGKQRVNIDHIGSEDLKPPQVTGGYLLKFDRLGPGENGVFSGGDRGMIYVEPKEQTITLPQRAPQKDYLDKFLGDFDRALKGPNWKDPKLGYRAFLDVDAAIDFHVLEVLSGNVDAMVLSTYFSKERSGKIVCGPHWDFDRALGSTDGRDANPREWNTGPFFGGAWWPRLFSDPDFWQLWVDRWQDLRRTHFSLANLNALIDRLGDQVREAQPREYQKWGLQARGGTFQSELDLMKDWLSNRIDFIDQQLAQPPRLNASNGPVAPGFLLTLSAKTNATVYYTLNGSDPRAAEGTVSSNAVVYKDSIAIKSDVQVVARAHDPLQKQTGGPPTSTPWSAPVKVNLVVSGRR